MCGIAGIIAEASRQEPDLPASVMRMGDAIAHRGPDARGTWVAPSGNVGVAHRRLSIIDLSEAGHQPMASHDDELVLVYNGEIYNFQDLRMELDSIERRPWRSNTDTEILLRAIEHWGVRTAVEKLIGMFAFAVFNARDSTLTLARDRLGQKPLFYYESDGVFAFASELKSLLASDVVPRKVDNAAATEFLRRGYIQAPDCILAGVRKLPPGAIMTIDCRSARVREVTTYWSLREIAVNSVAGWGREQDWAGELEAMLDDAVSRRLVADVKVGTLLSGGIDSTLITSSAVLGRDPRSINTYTIGFAESVYDESVAAGDIAAHLGTNHHSFKLTPEMALSMIPELPKIYDEPFGDYSQLPTVLVCREARKHVTVALSGDGGDEFFHGYGRYQRKLQQWERMRRFPLIARRIGGSLVGATGKLGLEFAERTGMSVSRAYDAVRIGDGLTARDLVEAYAKGTSSWVDPGALMREPAGRQDHEEQLFGDSVSTIAYLDQLAYLPDDILCKVDRASMSVGLEMRSPLLDHRLVELSWRIPPDAKYRNGRGKMPLWDLLLKRVPRKLVDRPKQGFGVPIDNWLHGPLRDWAAELLSEKAINETGFLDPNTAARLWRLFDGGQKNMHTIIWHMLVLQSWARHYRVHA